MPKLYWIFLWSFALLWFVCFIITAEIFHRAFGFPESLLFSGNVVFKLVVLFSGSVLLSYLLTDRIFSRQAENVKAIVGSEYRDYLGARHTRKIELKLPYEKAFTLCRESLKAIRKNRIRKEDSSKGIIEAKTGVTKASWGEIITLQVSRVHSDVSMVEVSSRPYLKTNIFEGGHDLRNVVNITAFLEMAGGSNKTYPI